jgi:predicted ATPase/DNA-binding winged helix-turn-helix (wHTH) protein
LPQGYSFDEYQLFPALRRLSRHNKVVHVSPTAMRILTLLVQRHGQVVTKEDFLKEVWFDSPIEEINLAIQIGRLRKLLGSEAIRTIYGTGYQFALPVVPFVNTAEAPIPLAPDPNDTGLKSNLPRPLTSITGRAPELAELEADVKQHRLVTLTGPGGIGKTRLAVEVGWQVVEDFPDGVWLIELATLRAADSIVSATAMALGIPLIGTEAPLEAIAAAIAKRRLLLIFDNCEHLAIAAAAFITKVLTRTSGLSVLATSQKVLGVVGEWTYRLTPLPLPPPGASEIGGFGAIQLFIERAHAADRRFSLDDDNAATVAAICRGLDGMPLALEMAASRLALLGLQGLQARLDEQLNLFDGATFSGETRHGSLRAVVEWSYGLLEDPERQFYRRLAIFPSSFSLDAAIAVAGADGVEPWEGVGTLGRLVDKSLVSVEWGEPPRYRLLEALRLHAVEQLENSGESTAIAERHARFFVELFDRAYDEWETMPNTIWLASYGSEIDNVRAGLEWALADAKHARLAVAIAGVAVGLCDFLSLIPEGRRYLDRTVNLINPETSGTAAARLLHHGGRLWLNADRPRALGLIERSADIYRQSGDKIELAQALTTISGLFTFGGRYTEAKTMLEEAKDMLSASGHTKSLSAVLSYLACSLLIRMTQLKAGDIILTRLSWRER